MKRAIIVAVVAAALIAAIVFVPKAGGWKTGRGEILATSTDAVPIRGQRHELINSYFAKRNMPLEGTGEAMVEAADKYGIDWRLLPAIAVRESSGGKEACGRNPFGWGSCKKGIGEFKTWKEAIDKVGWNLGGWNPRTAPFYSGGTEAKLKAYNPPTIVPAYAAEVMAIMRAIGPEEVLK